MISTANLGYLSPGLLFLFTSLTLKKIYFMGIGTRSYSLWIQGLGHSGYVVNIEGIFLSELFLALENARNLVPNKQM